MTQQRTTISLNETVLNRIRDSGVRNVSRYLANLAKKDLEQLHHAGVRENVKIKAWEAELDAVELEWRELEKRRTTT